MDAAAIKNENADFMRPLPALLETLAGEIDVVRSLGERIELAVCAAGKLSGTGDALVEDLQQIDLMLQQLAALRDFLHAIAATGAHDNHVQIAAGLARITLAEMKSRLSGQSASGAAPGDLDLW